MPHSLPVPVPGLLPSDLRGFHALHLAQPAQANRQLFAWLSDDAARSTLYRAMIDEGVVLEFQSNANVNSAPGGLGLPPYRQTAYLLAHPDHIRAAFVDTQSFSNSPFLELGSGSFMLALDPGTEHDEQRAYALRILDAVCPSTQHALATLAFGMGADLTLKTRRFDLADLAEQVALRYMALFFGFPASDHALLETTMRQAYRGLNYQMMARHFVNEPGTVPEAGRAMAALLQRVTTLLGLYQAPVGRAQEDERKLLDEQLDDLRAWSVKGDPDQRPLAQFTPLLRTMALPSKTGVPQPFTAVELGVVVVGLIAGAIGNLQAAICNATNGVLRQPREVLDQIMERARTAYAHSRRLAAPNEEFEQCVWEALRLAPPAAFLPRRAQRAVTLGGTAIPKDSLILLGVGGATRHTLAASDQYHLSPRPQQGHAAGCPMHTQPRQIFGGCVLERAYVHSCVGQTLSMPLVHHAVRQILLLPGLTEAQDTRTGERIGQRKLWGYGTTTYPVEYRRAELLRHTSLNVVMRVKSPTAVHAEALKAVIRAGAPAVTKVLNDAKHIHFAWFMFLENDTLLNLNTIYDRDFDSYIEHFALKVGPLFDQIFQHIEEAPPMPVNDHPKAFIDTIRRFNRRPAGEYIYSAYPQTECSQIVRHFTPSYTYDYPGV